MLEEKENPEANVLNIKDKNKDKVDFSQKEINERKLLSYVLDSILNTHNWRKAYNTLERDMQKGKLGDLNPTQKKEINLLIQDLRNISSFNVPETNISKERRVDNLKNIIFTLQKPDIVSILEKSSEARFFRELGYLWKFGKLEESKRNIYKNILYNTEDYNHKGVTSKISWTRNYLMEKNPSQPFLLSLESMKERSQAADKEIRAAAFYASTLHLKDSELLAVVAENNNVKGEYENFCEWIHKKIEEEERKL